MLIHVIVRTESDNDKYEQGLFVVLFTIGLLPNIPSVRSPL